MLFFRHSGESRNPVVSGT